MGHRALLSAPGPIRSAPRSEETRWAWRASLARWVIGQRVNAMGGTCLEIERVPEAGALTGGGRNGSPDTAVSPSSRAGKVGGDGGDAGTMSSVLEESSAARPCSLGPVRPRDPGEMGRKQKEKEWEGQPIIVVLPWKTGAGRTRARALRHSRN